MNRDDPRLTRYLKRQCSKLGNEDCERLSLVYQPIAHRVKLIARPLGATNA